MMHFFCFIPMSFGAKEEFRYYLNCSIQLSLGQERVKGTENASPIHTLFHR